MGETTLIAQMLVKNSDTSPETMIWRNQRSVEDNSVRAIKGKNQVGAHARMYIRSVTVPLESRSCGYDIVET